MVHEARKVLKVVPEIVDRFRRAVDVNALTGANRAVPSDAVAHLLAAEKIERRDAGNRGGGCGDPSLRPPVRRKREGQKRQIHHIAADARPNPARGPPLSQYAYAARDFSNAEEAKEPGRTPHTDQARQRPRG